VPSIGRALCEFRKALFGFGQFRRQKERFTRVIPVDAALAFHTRRGEQSTDLRTQLRRFGRFRRN